MRNKVLVLVFILKLTCWILFLIQNIADFFRAPILKNLCELLLLTMFMKLRKVRNCWSLHKKTGFFNINIRNKWEKCISLCFYFMTGFLWSFYLRKYFYDVVRNKLQTKNTYTWVDNKKIKSSGKEYVVRTCFKFWPTKNIFRKL